MSGESVIRHPTYKRGWFAALAVFVLAGLTGAFIRIGLIYGFSWGLQYANVRHAHSHLMHFGWVTPALIALIAANLPAVTGRDLTERFKGPIVISIVGALLRRLCCAWPARRRGDHDGGIDRTRKEC